MRARHTMGVGCLLFSVLAPPLPAKDKAPDLTHTSVHPSGAFSVKTPASWTASTNPQHPDYFEVAGDGALVRFLYQGRDLGYDGLHVTCMVVFLAGPMNVEPRVQYEYDFLSGQMGERRFLDSAFVVQYDAPVAGARIWHQRNLTVVSPNDSLCIISYVPEALWKKSKETRTLLDAVVNSVEFRKDKGKD